MTVLEMAREVIRLTGSRSPITYQSLPVDDPKLRRPDINQAKEWLDWEPQVGLVEGLTATIDWFRQTTPISKV